MVAPLALMGLSAAADLVGGVLSNASAAMSAASRSDAPAAGGTDKLKKTAKDFESMFLEQAFDRLTENAGEDGPLGAGGTGGSVYRSMLVKEYAGQVVKSGGVGIGDAVYRQMLQLQEGANGG